MHNWFSALTVTSAMMLSGCAYFPDFATSPVYHVPVAEVTNQIKCDIYGFLLGQQAVRNPNFSLDKNGYATVELALSATAYGDIKATKVDTLDLHAQHFLAVGSSVKPFPTLETKALKQTTAKIQVNISQDPAKLAGSCDYGSILSDDPHADRILVNRMRIRDWLTHVFEQAQRVKQHGPSCNAISGRGSAAPTCVMSLETATLSTKFELIVDMSAGVLSLAKLIPVVLATPTLQINADYYHQITVIFHGNNAVADMHAKQKVSGGARAAPGARTAREAPRAPATADDATAAIVRELRAIRDATVLSAPH